MEEKVLIDGKFSSDKSELAVWIMNCVFCVIIMVLSGSILFILAALAWMIYSIVQAVNSQNYKKQTLTITDKRVYGNLLSKSIDLPLSAISHVERVRNIHFNIATTSGTMKFFHCDNCAEVVQTISDLLQERNAPKPNMEPLVVSKPEPAPQPAASAPMSSFDEVRKYKELLDDGIITQEEFDAKKKEILGL